jgi:peptidyl-prolyl cis-trans isomerase A (cyclophilin A)
MTGSAVPPQSGRVDRWTRRSVISGLAALGIAQVPGRSAAADAGTDRFCRVVIDTVLGSIEVMLELGRAPISAGDFLEYVDRGLYAGGAFYRTVRPDDDPQPIKIEVVQGGLTDDSKYLDPIAHEPTSRTGLRHRNGTISIGRDAVGTGTAGAFFVCIGDQPELDFGGRRNPDGQGFAAFGRVTRGMQLIRDMGALKTQGPPGSHEGELIASPVRILGARRVQSRHRARHSETGS